MKFDNILETVGEFGPSQRRLYILLSLPAVYNAVIGMVIFVFLFAVPEHRCAIPGMKNDTFQIQSEAHADLINRTMPLDNDNGDLPRSSCFIYSTSENASSRDMNTVTEPCHKWTYDKSVYQSTVAQTMDLVCDRKLYVSHAKMMAMVGQLVGVLIGGPMSDMFGRRRVILACVFVSVLLSICLTWITDYYLLITVVLVISASNNVQYLSCFVFSMECVGPSKRMLVGVAMNLFWSAGNIIVALMVFLMRDWKTRQLAISVPGILFAYLYFLPDSPRWQYSRGKTAEANKTVMKLAKGNKVRLTQDMLYDVTCTLDNHQEQFWELLKSPVMLKRILIILYTWLAIGMGFFGLSMNVTNLSGNVYLNFLLFVLVEACAYVICLLLMDRIGRKKMLCTAMLMAGIACALSFVPFFVTETPNKWIINILACLGNTCVSAGFAAVYVFTAELLPTTSRNFGMGISSLFCRIGSISSPYINDLTMHITSRYSQILPMLIFGGVSFIAGLLVLLLPETLNVKLPETIKDAEKIGTNVTDDAIPSPAQELLRLDRECGSRTSENA
ncbi:organic cation transporter protein-like [Haliotis rubra]|uniref:organic cation transporter protein-like n=1 Tax=Haliotis rubra TaxID=36100 RepID=UPI001EE5507A|nr:organic cation transporter protein-like [Haliotis rubra]